MNYSLGNRLSGGGALNPDGLALDLAFAADKTLTARKGPTPTFTRGSTATFVGSNGLIQSAVINAPRFDHDPVTLTSRGLLIEEQRTNLVFQSNDWTLSPWTGNATRSRSSETSPNGTLSSTLATSNATGFGGFVRSNAIFLANSTACSASAFVKKGNHSFVAIDYAPIRIPGSLVPFFDLDANTFNSNGSSVTGSIVNYPNGWKKITVSGSVLIQDTIGITGWTVDSNGNINTSVSGRTAHWWGAQLEVGSFPTSYIPTTTAALTRSADVCSITGADFTIFYNPVEGSVAVSASSPAIGNRAIVGIDDNTANEMIRLRTEGSDPFYRVTDGGSDVVALDLGSVTANASFKIASAYALNNFAASLNGGSASTDSVGTLPTVDRLRIGADQGGNTITGTIGRISYYKKRLANAKLQTLST